MSYLPPEDPKEFRKETIQILRWSTYWIIGVCLLSALTNDIVIKFH